jgi:glycosyltransferase involved in cell wall biosynthesis
MSLIADALLARGHDVVWWSSTFDHSKKAHRRLESRIATLSTRYEIRLLHGVGYRTNVSLSRIANHTQIGLAFAREAPCVVEPDLVLAAFPTIELAYAGVRYARRRGIPAIVDIRDLWPDLFLDAVPRPLRALGRYALAPLFGMARRTMSRATAISAISNTYLDWGLRLAGRSCVAEDRVTPLGYPRPRLSDTSETNRRELLRRLGIDNGSRIALFVGTFGRTYDLTSVINAAERLARDGDHRLQFVFVGTGDLERRWREEAAHLPNVLFTGWLDSEDINLVLSAAWVGLAAYATGAPQSLPNKFFEYISVGLPVVSSLGGETASLIDAAQCGVHYATSDELATKLKSLLGEPQQYQDMRRAAQQLYDENYSADRVYERFARYLEAVSQRGR